MVMQSCGVLTVQTTHLVFIIGPLLTVRECLDTRPMVIDRSWLMISNTVWDFQLYTIIHHSCCLFLREDEVGSSGYDLNHGATVIKSNDHVKGIAVDIKRLR